MSAERFGVGTDGRVVQRAGWFGPLSPAGAFHRYMVRTIGVERWIDMLVRGIRRTGLPEPVCRVIAEAYLGKMLES